MPDRVPDIAGEENFDNPAERIRNVIEVLNRASDRLQTADGVAAFVLAAARLWQYDVSTIVLLAEQADRRSMTLTELASPSLWRESGRNVRPDEQPFATLAKRWPDRPTIGIVPVFDVSQTIGSDVPSRGRANPNPANRMRRLDRDLRALLRDAEWAVVEESGSGFGGTADHLTQEIRLPPDLPAEDETAVLLRRTFDAFLHSPADPIAGSSSALAAAESDIGTRLVLAAHEIPIEAASATPMDWPQALDDAQSAVRRLRPGANRTSDVARGVLGRVHAVAQTLLIATDPAHHGGNLRGLDLDTRFSIERGPARDMEIPHVPTRRVTGPTLN